jgi:tetratricopeptide (TPR) repeat protein
MNLALDIDPENPYRYSSRAYIKDFFGDIEGAIADYEKCVEMDPQDFIALNNLGLLVEKKGNLKKAQHYFKRTDDLLERNPNWQSRIYNADEESENNDAPQLKSTMQEDQQSKPIVKSSQPSKANIWKASKDVLTKKSVFKEFIRFVLNGFKLSK